MRKFIFCAVPMLALGASKASASIVYDNTGGGLAQSNQGLFDTGITSIYFDDATLSVAAPAAINQFNLGYTNPTGSADTFDILVQFFNNVNYNAGSGMPVGTDPIGGVLDITGVTAAADSIGQTGLVTVPGNVLTTTGTVGFEIEFVTPGSTTFGTADEDGSIEPIFNSTPPLVGSSNPDFAYDYMDEGTIVGNDQTGDIFTFGSPAANIYAQIGAVPEPTSFGLLAAGSMFLLSRRKRVIRSEMRIQSA
jgi:hypothetical protein